MIDEVEVNNFGSKDDAITLKHDAMGFGKHWAMTGTIFGTKAIDKKEAKNIHRMVRKLNKKMKEAVSRANKESKKDVKRNRMATEFHYIDGIRSRFGGMGSVLGQRLTVGSQTFLMLSKTPVA